VIAVAVALRRRARPWATLTAITPFVIAAAVA
jgi:hypothetical protein